MSVYQGFATRQQETSYCKQLVNLIKILQRRILKFYLNEPTDEDAFKKIFQQHAQIYSKIKQMEENKYIEPFFGIYLSDLCNYFSNGSGLVQQMSNQIFPSKKCTCFCHQSQNDLKLSEDQTFLTKVEKNTLNIKRGPETSLPHQPMNDKILEQKLNEMKSNLRSIARENYKQKFPYSLTNQRLKYPIKEYYSNRKESKQFNLKLIRTKDNNSYSPNRSIPLKQPTINNRSPYHRTAYSLNINGKMYQLLITKQIKIQFRFNRNQQKIYFQANDNKFIFDGNMNKQKTLFKNKQNQIAIIDNTHLDENSILDYQLNEENQIIKSQSLYASKSKKNSKMNFDNQKSSQNASLEVQNF